MKTMTLSKSRFKVALECPRKLVYAADPVYHNTFQDDDFLESLADGGHQVGALAKLMHPGGIEITAPAATQVAETLSLATADTVTLFEPTFQCQNLLVRIDVLVKRGNDVELIEVKSKSLAKTSGFRDANGNVDSQWFPYLADVAFQHHVLSHAMPTWRITPYLMLIDPDAVCSAPSLATRLTVVRRGKSVSVAVDPTLQPPHLTPPLLSKRNVDVEVDEILKGPLTLHGLALPFREYLRRLSTALASGEEFAPHLGKRCKTCEFYCDPSESTDTHRSGWAECMTLDRHEPVHVRRSETIFGLCNDRRTDKRLEARQLLLTELSIDCDEERDSISASHRHWLQVEEAKGQRTGVVLRSEALRAAFRKWRYPLHFIDFETARPTIPFHAGHRPNQQLLFQFSHHVLEEDGRLAHRTQSLVTAPGIVPNIEVIRALRDALSSDHGTVIHWWTHERTVLGDMRRYLDASTAPDEHELVRFIDSLLHPMDGREARLQDLGLPLVSKLAFFPGTDGKSSIKRVLPAVLQHSDHVQGIYSRPVYATSAMPSLNFARPWTWVQFDGTRVRDPYELLDPLVLDEDLRAMIRRAEEDDDASGAFIKNGGAALIAYGQLQRTDLPAAERTHSELQLKRYCELDSLAMVMIYQALAHWIQ